MKKTLTINISGIVFHIDEDAYETLQEYLSMIHRRFENTEEGKEIIADIEARIAELFSERLKDSKQVVCLDDVNEIITTMGDPGEFDEDGEADEDAYRQEKTREWKVGRRLYRDGDSRVLGGVCAGIGAYFDIDPIIVRVIFIIALFIPGFFLVYILLWIVIPEALTTAQKLEMRGERVNISNIERSINEEFTEVKNNFRNFSKTRQYERTKESVHSVFHFIGLLITGFVKIVLGIVGVSFVLVGIFILIVMAGSFFTESSFFWPQEDFHGLTMSALLLFSDIENVRLFLVGILMVIGIPLLAIIYGGFKLLFKFDSNDKAIGVIGFVIWLVGLMITAGSVFMVGKDMRASERIYDETTLIESNSELLYVSAKPDTLSYGYTSFSEVFDFDEVKVVPYSDRNKIYITPEFNVRKSDDNQIHIILRKEARGKNKRDSYQNAQSIQYQWNQLDSLLILDRYYTFDEHSKWRAQEFKLTIELPVGKSIILDDSMNEIVWESGYINNRIWPGNLVNQAYIMLETGLEKKE
jgi:phage shock protein PspC (stress-responsive transcriptional regulator)